MSQHAENTPVRKTRVKLAVGIIGFGAIGQAVADAVCQGHAGAAELKAVLCRNVRKHRKALLSEDPKVCFTDRPEAFFSAPMDLVVEAAGQDALRIYGHRVLAKGWDLLVSSIGAFTDENLFQELIREAEQTGAQLLLASGALPAVDWMAAAAPAGVSEVSITQAKPVASWQGTPAARMLDLERLKEPTCFFEGSAREAASRFPKSSNITAMLALSTAGMDKTRVKLVADPTGTRMQTFIRFDGPAGNLRIEWQGVPSEKNPKTSADVPLSVIKAIRNLASPVFYGP